MAPGFGLLDRAAASFVRALRRNGWLLLVVFLAVPVTGLLAGRTLGRRSQSGGILLAFVALASPATGAYFLARVSRLGERYQVAFDEGDADTMAALRRMFHGDGPLHDGPPDEEMGRRVGEAEEQIVRERWAEARDTLASIDREMVPPVTRPGILSNLAYATAHAGDPRRGESLAREAIALAGETDEYPPDRVVDLRGTLGIAQSLADDHELAIRTLERLVDVPGPPRAIAARAYFLARSLDALGRYDEAVAALEAAARQRGPWAERARDLLQNLTETPAPAIHVSPVADGNTSAR